MIPKKIHYCWFGGKTLPADAEACIKSWAEKCPDYELIRWDEQNVSLEDSLYARQAYEAEKWAFVSDYVRLKALWEQGGIYMDTDVEVLRDISPLLIDEGFLGFENEQFVNSGQVMAAVPHQPVVQAMIEEYKKLHFTNADGSLNAVGCPHLNTDVMERFGLVRNGREQMVAGIHVYPADYFNPLDSVTGKLTKTENTYSIHWYSMSWLPKHKQIKAKFGRLWRRITKKVKS